MNLKEIRNEFCNQSGRLDLKTPSGADNGADFYIKAGQKFLDQVAEKHEDIVRVFRKVSTGDYFIYFKNCRAIHRVGVGDSEEFNWLEEVKLAGLRNYYNEPFGSIDRSKPSYYAPAYLRTENADDNLNGIVGYMDVLDSKEHNGVIFLPPVNQQYHIEVWGKFWTEELVEDSDNNYWSVRFPHLIVMAALRTLEIFYRNSQGVQDWTSEIMSELPQLEKDYAEELSTNISQIEG